MTGREAQALERALLEELGWEVLDRPRRESARHGDVVRMELGSASCSEEDPDLDRRTYEATVTSGRELPVPDCGAPLANASKSERELHVVGFHRL
jgi:hypothetical protein